MHPLFRNNTSRLKFFFVTLTAVLSIPPVHGKLLHGDCVDEKGDPVAYVNVIVEGTKVWSVSGSDGRFSINIPDSLEMHTIIFSHISHNDVKKKAGDLQKNTAGENMEIILLSKPYQLGESTVQAKGTKIKNLNFIGSSNPLLRTILGSNFRRDPSMGERVKIRKRASIKELEFNIINNTYDSLLLRTILYKVTKDIYEPLMDEPHYFSIPKGYKGKIVCALSPYNITAEGNVLINLEKVYSQGSGNILFPMYYDGGRTVSFLYPDREYELSICGIGLQLRGYYVD